jgi:hypothetical protein
MESALNLGQSLLGRMVSRHARSFGYVSAVRQVLSEEVRSVHLSEPVL